MANASDAALRRFERPAARQSAALDELVRQAVFGAPQEREQARWLIWEIGQAGGVRPASIHELYLARGRSEEHTSELQSLRHLVCRLLLEKKKKKNMHQAIAHTIQDVKSTQEE